MLSSCTWWLTNLFQEVDSTTTVTMPSLFRDLFVIALCWGAVRATLQPDVYCVNLPHEVERKQAMESRFHSANLQNVQWVGVDGSSLDLSDPSIVKSFGPSLQHLLSAEVGTALSHVNAWYVLSVD